MQFYSKIVYVIYIVQSTMFCNKYWSQPDGVVSMSEGVELFLPDEAAMQDQFPPGQTPP